MDVKSIFSYIFGDGPSKWIGWLVGLITLAGTLGLISSADGENFKEKIQNSAQWAWDKVQGMFTSWFDKESVNLDKGIEEQLTAARGFNSVDSMLGVTGLGSKLRDLAKDAAKQGGDPLENALKLHEQMRTETVAHLKSSKTGWQPADADLFVRQADAIATEFVGIPSDMDAAHFNPKNYKTGYIGMRLQAKTAKDAKDEMQASDVRPIVLNETALQQAIRAASTASDAGLSSDSPAPPTTGNRNGGPGATR